MQLTRKAREIFFSFLFSKQDAGCTLDGRGLLLRHMTRNRGDEKQGDQLSKLKNNAFCFPNEKLELDLRMIIGFIHWYMPTLLPELGPNHTYLQQSCCLSCRLSTVGESKPVFRWYPEMDSGSSLGSAMNSRPHFQQVYSSLFTLKGKIYRNFDD